MTEPLLVRAYRSWFPCIGTDWHVRRRWRYDCKRRAAMLSAPARRLRPAGQMSLRRQRQPLVIALSTHPARWAGVGVRGRGRISPFTQCACVAARASDPLDRWADRRRRRHAARSSEESRSPAGVAQPCSCIDGPFAHRGRGPWRSVLAARHGPAPHAVSQRYLAFKTRAIASLESPSGND